MVAGVEVSIKIVGDPNTAPLRNGSTADGSEVSEVLDTVCTVFPFEPRLRSLTSSGDGISSEEIMKSFLMKLYILLRVRHLIMIDEGGSRSAITRGND